MPSGGMYALEDIENLGDLRPIVSTEGSVYEAIPGVLHKSSIAFPTANRPAIRCCGDVRPPYILDPPRVEGRLYVDGEGLWLLSGVSGINRIDMVNAGCRFSRVRIDFSGE